METVGGPDLFPLWRRRKQQQRLTGNGKAMNIEDGMDSSWTIILIERYSLRIRIITSDKSFRFFHPSFLEQKVNILGGLILTLSPNHDRHC